MEFARLPGMTRVSIPSESQSDIQTLCDNASNAILSLLSSTFQHLREGDPKSKFCGVRSQLFIKSLEMKTLRLCLDRAANDFADLQHQEGEAIWPPYSAVDHPLPILPAEIVIHILSLAFRDCEIDLRNVSHAKHNNSDEVTLYKTLTSLHPQSYLRQLFLSSATFSVYALYVAQSAEELLRQLERSDPMKLSVSICIEHRFKPTSDQHRSLFLQFPYRWKELYIYRMSPEESTASLKKCLQVLPQLETFQFMDNVKYSVEEYYRAVEEFPDDPLNECPPRLRSANTLSCFLEKCVSSGFFRAVTDLKLQLICLYNISAMYEQLSALSELRSLSSLTLVEDTIRNGLNSKSDRTSSVSLPSLTTLHLRDFTCMGTENILDLITGCKLEDMLLTMNSGTWWTEPLRASRLTSLLHNRFPGLAKLGSNSHLDDFMRELSDRNKDGVWLLPALRSLAIVEKIDTSRLTHMLHARLRAPEVTPINYIEVRIPYPGKEMLGTDLIALHELQELVPNVVRLF